MGRREARRALRSAWGAPRLGPLISSLSASSAPAGNPPFRRSLQLAGGTLAKEQGPLSGHIGRDARRAIRPGIGNNRRLNLPQRGASAFERLAAGIYSSG